MNLVSVPIFPLPGLVLFPRTKMPLHIFEPRYVRMVEDALEEEGKLATANLRRGWEQDYFGTPPVHRTITIARILHHETLPGKRYDILLEGIERAGLVEEVSRKPYRRVKAASLVDLMDDHDRAELRESIREMLALASQIADRLPEMSGLLRNIDNRHQHPGIIADQIASILVKDTYERQSLLEQRRVLRRVELLNVQLRRRLAHASSRRSKESDIS